ncbi:MAG TPA: hypothetical protein PLF40_06865 [Kofleriaceae bacterium]|nr:hypothetical protein [Kofleriaceae bacterium]
MILHFEKFSRFARRWVGPWPRFIALIAVLLLLFNPTNYAPPLSGFWLLGLAVLVIHPGAVLNPLARWRHRNRPRVATATRDPGLQAMWEREQVARTERGGNPDLPFVVRSAATIEGKAARQRCLHCNATLRLVEHKAVAGGDLRRRKINMRCRNCGAQRFFWFEIISDLSN